MLAVISHQANEGSRTVRAAEIGAAPPHAWETAKLDIDAYLERVGYDGSLTPTAETLRALHRAHTLAVPFENLDIPLGRPIRLDMESLKDKLIRRRRGGYCHEQNILFATALDRLGFRVTGLSARGPMGSRQGPATAYGHGHTILKVEAEGAAWLADVGVGNLGPVEPVPLEDGVEVAQGGWSYRLDWITIDDAYRGWLLRQKRPDGWFDVYSFTLEPYFRADYANHNFIASTHPDSPFVDQLIVQRNGDDVRPSLTGRDLVLRRPGEAPETRVIDPDELPDLLRETFGLDLSAREATNLVRIARDSPGG